MHQGRRGSKSGLGGGDGGGAAAAGSRRLAGIARTRQQRRRRQRCGAAWNRAARGRGRRRRSRRTRAPASAGTQRHARLLHAPQSRAQNRSEAWRQAGKRERRQQESKARSTGTRGPAAAAVSWRRGTRSGEAKSGKHNTERSPCGGRRGRGGRKASAHQLAHGSEMNWGGALAPRPLQRRGTCECRPPPPCRRGTRHRRAQRGGRTGAGKCPRACGRTEPHTAQTRRGGGVEGHRRPYSCAAGPSDPRCPGKTRGQWKSAVRKQPRKREGRVKETRNGAHVNSAAVGVSTRPGRRGGAAGGAVLLALHRSPVRRAWERGNLQKQNQKCAAGREGQGAVEEAAHANTDTRARKAGLPSHGREGGTRKETAARSHADCAPSSRTPHADAHCNTPATLCSAASAARVRAPTSPFLSGKDTPWQRYKRPGTASTGKRSAGPKQMRDPGRNAPALWGGGRGKQKGTTPPTCAVPTDTERKTEK